MAPHSSNASPHSAIRNQGNSLQHEGSNVNSLSNRTVGPDDTHGLSGDRTREPIDDQAPTGRPIKTERMGFSHESEVPAHGRPVAANDERQDHIGQSSRPPTQNRPGTTFAGLQVAGARPTVNYDVTYRDVQVSISSNVNSFTNRQFIVTPFPNRQVSDLGPGHRAMLQQLNVFPAQALGGATGNHDHQTNVTLGINPQSMPTQNGMMPIQATGNLSRQINVTPGMNSGPKPTQSGLMPIQATGNHYCPTNVIPGMSSRPIPTQHGVMPIQVSASPEGVTNGRPTNRSGRFSEAHQHATPLCNGTLLPQPPGDAEQFPYGRPMDGGFRSSAAHLPATPLRTGALRRPAPGSASASDGDFAMHSAAASIDSTPRNIAPRRNVLRTGQPYESNYVPPRSRPRDGPPGAVSFRGVSQGGMLLWNCANNDWPIARQPITDAEMAVVYEHLIFSARQMAETASDRQIWEDALRRLETNAIALEGRYDESEIIRYYEPRAG